MSTLTELNARADAAGVERDLLTATQSAPGTAAWLDAENAATEMASTPDYEAVSGASADALADAYGAQEAEAG